jgi:hypothetical protein
MKKQNFLALFIMLSTVGIYSGSALALDVYTVYRPDCASTVGAIVQVDTREIVMLTTSGRVEKIERVDIIGLASYSIPSFPLRTIDTESVDNAKAYAFTFSTFRNQKMMILARGWPISFADDSLVLLTADWQEQTVLRDDIWKVESVAKTFKVVPKIKDIESSIQYKLLNPLQFGRCKSFETAPGPHSVAVVPHESPSEPVEIKNFLDKLQDSYKKIESYAARQKFYAVPQVFTNQAKMGTWYTLGSRYTTSGARQANLIPFVSDEKSDGPFGFQRRILSGPEPISWAIHEEPVVQVSYAMKGDYFNLHGYIDPSSILIGRKYEWSATSLSQYDERVVEKAGGVFGFDYGYFGLFGGFTSIELGVRSRDIFSQANGTLSRFGLRWQMPTFRMEAIIGSTSFDKNVDGQEFSGTVDFMRFNLAYNINSRLKISPQFIQRKIENENTLPVKANMNAETQTLVAGIDWQINYRWQLNVQPSFESQHVQGNDGQPFDKNLFHSKLTTGFYFAF